MFSLFHNFFKKSSKTAFFFLNFEEILGDYGALEGCSSGKIR